MKKRNYRYAELGSRRIILALLLNVLVIAFFCMLGFIISRNQIERGILDADDGVVRVVVLCLLLGLLLLSVMDYFLLVKPVIRMEELLDEYIRLADDAGNRLIIDQAQRLTVRRAFAQLIYQERWNIQKNKALEREQLSSELHALQARINPHFLYNTLDCIRGLALYHEMDEIAELTESFSRLFRSMVLPEGKLLPLRKEIENISDYVRIQKFRFNNNFEYICEISDEILDKYRILNMTLQPIVENAVMHGLEQKVGMGYVRIRASITERRLIIDVTDNGVGISELKVRELNESFNMGLKFYTAGNNGHNSGIGLATINRRIKLQFGDQYGLHIYSTRGVQTTAQAVLPLIVNNG